MHHDGTSSIDLAASQKTDGKQRGGKLVGSLPAGMAEIVTPQDMTQLQTLVRTEGPVRPVGSGHSWMPLVPADGPDEKTAGVVVRLDAFGGVLQVDATKQQARLGAGGKLKDLSPLLAEHGLAFRNLGDIDVQSLAGATSTATHGTGKTLPCLAAEICGLTLMTAQGEVMRIDGQENAALLPAAQVSLGALGLITEMDMQLVAAHKLHRRVDFDRWMRCWKRPCKCGTRIVILSFSMFLFPARRWLSPMTSPRPLTRRAMRMRAMMR